MTPLIRRIRYDIATGFLKEFTILQVVKATGCARSAGRRPRAPIAVGLGLAAMIGGFANAATAGVALELNKLEPQGPACRVYLLAEPSEDYQSLKLDLVLFGVDGVIARRLAVEAGPLTAGKRSVKLFDLQETGCETIGSILINDVMTCEGAEGPLDGCIAGIETSSRAAADFIK